MYPSRRSGSGRMSVTTWIQEGWNGRSARASVNRGASARRTAVQATRLGIIPGRGSHLRGLVVEARVPPELLPRLRVHVIDLHGGRSVYLAQPLPRCAAPSPAGSNGEFPKAATVGGRIYSRKIDRHLANTRFCRGCAHHPDTFERAPRGGRGPSYHQDEVDGGVLHQRAAASFPPQRPLRHGRQRRRGRRRLWRPAHQQLHRRDRGALAVRGAMVATAAAPSRSRG